MREYRSKNEEKVHQLLKELFPNVPIEREYYLGKGCYLDFLIKSAVPIGVEVDGVQHKEYNKHFHKNKAGFQRQLERDFEKERICKLKGIYLVRIDASNGIDEKAFKLDFIEKFKNAEVEIPRRRNSISTKKDQYRNQASRKRREYNKKRYRYLKEVLNKSNKNKGGF